MKCALFFVNGHIAISPTKRRQLVHSFANRRNIGVYRQQAALLTDAKTAENDAEQVIRGEFAGDFAERLLGQA